MIYLVCYDISENKLRTKVSDLLVTEGYERIQYSIFAGPTHPVLNTALWKRLEQLLERSGSAEYKLYVIPVPDQRFLGMDIIGDMGLDLEYVAGKKSTVIF